VVVIARDELRITRPAHFFQCAGRDCFTPEQESKHPAHFTEHTKLSHLH